MTSEAEIGSTAQQHCSDEEQPRVRVWDGREERRGGGGNTPHDCHDRKKERSKDGQQYDLN